MSADASEQTPAGALDDASAQSSAEGYAGDHAALLQLCERNGIAPDYYDIWGRRRVVPDHGLRAILRSMDVEAGNAVQVHASLNAQGGAQAALAARRPLPPVVVFWQDEGAWTVALQAAAREGSMYWVLVEEGGRQHQGPVDEFQILLPGSLPIGYHRLDLRIGITAGAAGGAAAGAVAGAAAGPAAAGGGEAAESRLLASTLVIVAPRRCYFPPALEEGRRVWGPAVQLYSVRSERNWGIGDFTDLAQVVSRFGAHGAALVGLNPLHALFPHNPQHASPYAPSSRRFLDVLYIDVEAVPEFRTCSAARAQVFDPAFQARLHGLRSTELVDYVGVSAAKLPILELLYACFRHGQAGVPDAERWNDFRAFQAGAGPALRQHALFETLQEHFHALDAGVWGWPQWPYAYRDPGSPEVAAFAQDHIERIEFFEYLQWLAEQQLAAAGAASMRARLAVGLYQDLAVSIDRGGADSWAGQDLYAQSASAGCPPDDFNLHGQDWGLLPLLPERLRARAYAPFIAVLRANMRHAGALRIDHVMGLARLFWVPRGDLPEAGAYVSYPFDHLVAIVALESQRNHCMVIGEDLGTVADEVRHAMQRSRMLSYRVLYFSHGEGGEYLAPGAFPRDALVTSATHDLATLAGFWEGRDIEVRRSLGLFPTEAVHREQVEQRKHDCARLVAALAREGLLPPEIGPEPIWPLPLSTALAQAVQEYLARAPSRVLVVQLEDIFASRDQVNLPGTVDQYPNWRRKLPVPIEHWEEDGRLADLAARLAAARQT